MVSETAISAILTASIAGAGLIIAIYALISPISTKIFRDRVELLLMGKWAFDKIKRKIRPESPDKEFKDLKTLASGIKHIESFPKYLRIGVLFVFLGYMFTAHLAFGRLFSTSSQNDVLEFMIWLSFMISTNGFALVGLYAIHDVYRAMKKEFERLKEEAEEVVERARAKI